MRVCMESCFITRKKQPVQTDRATHFGIVFDKKTRAINRIFNPDYEFEFETHYIAPAEEMLLVPKAEFGISLEPNSMSLNQVSEIMNSFKT